MFPGEREPTIPGRYQSFRACRYSQFCRRLPKSLGHIEQ
jgi:hypothetical protein